MRQTRITAGLCYVEPDSMARFSSCAGLVIRSRKQVFIDMNLGGSDTRTLLENERPDAALITHFHLDHSIWTCQAEKAGVQVFVPAKEAAFLTSIEHVIAHTAGPLGQGDPWREFVENTLGYQPLEQFFTYDHETVLTELAPELVILETPGHSPGHSSFYFPDDKILFSGDMGLDRFGPWYGWQNSDICELAASLLRLDGMDIRLILTSHGGMISKGIPGVFMAGVQRILMRERRIQDQLAAGVSEAQIIKNGVFYSRKDTVAPPMRNFLYMWETAMFRHHLRLLEKGGLTAFFPELSHISQRTLP
jgi:hydroxyacylglutathione hydrolase